MYLLQYNIYNYFSYMFDSFESSSGINFQELPEDDSKESKHVARIIIYVILK